MYPEYHIVYLGDEVLSECNWGRKTKGSKNENDVDGLGDGNSPWSWLSGGRGHTAQGASRKSLSELVWFLYRWPGWPELRDHPIDLRAAGTDEYGTGDQ